MEINRLQEQLQKRILILDGAMGTMLQNANLTAKHFGGEQYEGCNEQLNLTSPNIIQQIHEQYLEAGADIIETNTFGATSIVLADYGLEQSSFDINVQAAKIAKAAAQKYSTQDHPRFVAGSIGPTTKAISVTGGVSYEELVEAYYEQALGLLKGGVNLLIIETSQDTRNVKAAYIGIQKSFFTTGKEIPLIVSGTIEPMGTMLAGQNIEAFYLSIEHMNPMAVGLNCATGPEFMQDHIRSLSSLSKSAMICFPNAGLPDEEGCYHETPVMLAEKLKHFASQGWLNIVGGCCGTTPQHIKAMKEATKDLKPRSVSFDHPHAVSGIEPLFLDDSMRPLLVGERTNVIGSRKFKRLIEEGEYEQASEIARSQVKKGAHVVDICLANPDRDELKDMEQFLPYVVNKVKVPLMIDSTDEQVMETALTYCQGKSIINSINLEDGEEKLAKCAKLMKRYGAAVVVGTIDEEGMAITVERKLQIAKRCYDLLVNKYGIDPKDIIFDPLVFPVGTGDVQYIGAAKETVLAIKEIKEQLPHCLTILGVSNVSFGLPPVGREVLNSVFLYHCTQAGLDYAIVNTEKLQRYPSISIEEKQLCEQVLFQTNDQIIADFTQYYRGKKEIVTQAQDNRTIQQRLSDYIIEGTKDGLIKDLEKARKSYDSPLEIINGPLMAGMEQVGKLFNNNELIVAEVLQSAEVMKAAVQYLEPFMEKSESISKGKIIIATVKGDVHDIGKNLVEIILSNNGFDVINLGIKVTSNDLIEAVKKEKPNAIGLSGLLVKSAQQMVLTAADLKEHNISIPILVGGAALTRKFTETKIQREYEGAVLYAKDAMQGLEIANDIVSKKLMKKKVLTPEKLSEKSPRSHVNKLTEMRSNVQLSPTIATPNDTQKHLYDDYKLSHIVPYINFQTLLGKHLGLKGNVAQLLKEGHEKALQLKEVVDQFITEIISKKLLTAKAIYQFFPARSDGNTIIVYDPKSPTDPIQQFTFPRQQKAPYLCLADFVSPTSSGVMDYIGMFTVTAGHGVKDIANEWKERGDYLRSHMLQAIALEFAEAFSEHLHHVMRNCWGILDHEELTMQDRFSAKYQGIRVSFGYPACPNLEDQLKLFELLKPKEIGIKLTDGLMMDPEASVSAIVFSHPEARYFSV